MEDGHADTTHTRSMWLGVASKHPWRRVYTGKGPSRKPWGPTCQPLPLEPNAVAARTCTSASPSQLQRGLSPLPALITEGDLLRVTIQRNM